MLGFAPLASAALASSGDTNTRVLYLEATEAKDTPAISVNITATASMAVTDAPDVVDFLVGVATVIYLDTTEAPDTASFDIQNINLYLAGVEATDIAAISCEMSGTIVIAATEAPDVYSQSAYVLWTTPDDPDDPSIWVPHNDPAPYLTTVI
jgi:hypothetical protein